MWVDIIMDGPHAMALAVDPARDDVRRRPPRDAKERILDARRPSAIGRAGAVMAAGTVALPALRRSPFGTDTALTMAFMCCSTCSTPSARADDGALLGGDQLRNRTLWLCLAGVLVVQVIAVHLPAAREVAREATGPSTMGRTVPGRDLRPLHRHRSSART
ncbi:cation-translocating P-type ATPase C-terminal domain-containing protein [Streptomyces indiaensis]|uniref:Cation-transporting P-type ATPase C-terminal domain-containing protein n=2 Tax=Streptomyces indiaensis TaxID=284033 RepID=A0ABN3E1K7_9ACTN|nr:cation-translocating P-type ATPase C-terminal domain-containing protein [Streptomyces indiaensis]